MSITLSIPPAVVQEVRDYAERNNTSLNAIIRAYMEKIAEEERQRRAKEADEVAAYLNNQSGWLPQNYKFDREESNRR